MPSMRSATTATSGSSSVHPDDRDGAVEVGNRPRKGPRADHRERVPAAPQGRALGVGARPRQGDRPRCRGPPDADDRRADRHHQAKAGRAAARPPQRAHPAGRRRPAASGCGTGTSRDASSIGTRACTSSTAPIPRPSPAIPSDWTARLHPDDARGGRSARSTTRPSAGVPFDTVFRVVRTDGRHPPYPRPRPRRQGGDGPPVLVGTNWDVTEQVLAAAGPGRREGAAAHHAALDRRRGDLHRGRRHASP